MASIVWTRNTLLESLQELAGFKTGLLLSPLEIGKQLPAYAELLTGAPEEIVRTRSEEFEELAHTLIFNLGAAPTAEPAELIDLYARYYNDSEKLRVYNALTDLAFRMKEEETTDLNWFSTEAIRCFGELGREIASEIVAMVHRSVNESPWSRMRYVEWGDPLELSSLFESADLSTAHGEFIDQRFIDYLSRNFSALDEMHWRKFEGLAAEYFQREGAQVQLGPGTNDDGVDLRIWWPGNDPTKPAAILVQCKREKTKVSKTVLKALYADICHENATSGLIVTTQDLSLGAKKTKCARAYPIEAANRATLKEWITKMRSEHV